MTWSEACPEAVLPAGLAADFRDQLPAFLRENCGKWVRHDSPGPGLVRHLAADGQECWTLRLLLPPGGMLSTSTLRLLARWIRAYARAGRRTSRQGFELVGVDPTRLPELREEIRRAGLLAGGTGSALHQVKACVGFLHCQNALVDSPGIAAVLGDALIPLGQEGLPAALRISVAGCPNDCGGAHGADLGLMGTYRRGPRVRLFTGGRAGPRPRLGQAREYLPAEPPDYAAVVGHVVELVRAWCAGATPGERLGDWLAQVEEDDAGAERPVAPGVPQEVGGG